MDAFVCQAARRFGLGLILLLALTGCQNKPRWDENQMTPPIAHGETESRQSEVAGAPPTTPPQGENGQVFANAGPGENSIHTATRQGPATPAMEHVSLRPEQFRNRLTNTRQLHSNTSDAVLYKQLAVVGRDLSRQAPSGELKFEFSPLHNARPNVHHSSDGHIYVTTGMLERITNKDELAAVLAIEMAEVMAEQENTQMAQAKTEGWTNKRTAAAAGNDVDQMAANLLQNAGYQPSGVPVVRSKIAGWSQAERKMVTAMPDGRQMTN